VGYEGSGIPATAGGRPEESYTAEAREGVKRQFPGRDAELERLRRIEANYERDKAAMSREKAPALARSESHEVGHAEGEEVNEITSLEINEMTKEFQRAVIESAKLKEV
jgi:hypothetical protein